MIKSRHIYSLRHVRRPSDFDVPAAQHRAVHLFERELRAFGDFVLDEGEAFVLLRDGIPRHVDGLDGAEGKKSGADRVLLQLKRDAADVDSEN